MPDTTWQAGTYNAFWDPGTQQAIMIGPGGQVINGRLITDGRREQWVFSPDTIDVDGREVDEPTRTYRLTEDGTFRWVEEPPALPEGDE